MPIWNSESNKCTFLVLLLVFRSVCVCVCACIHFLIDYVESFFLLHHWYRSYTSHYVVCLYIHILLHIHTKHTIYSIFRSWILHFSHPRLRIAATFQWFRNCMHLSALVKCDLTKTIYKSWFLPAKWIMRIHFLDIRSAREREWHL